MAGPPAPAPPGRAPLRGRVFAVCTSEAKGTQKQARDAIVLVRGQGIAGDAHAGPGHRQVSLLAEERIDEMRRKGVELAPGAFGENIVTQGLDLDRVAIGHRLRLAGAILEVTQIGKECHERCPIFYLAGDCIMPREGVFARVLEGGTVRVGDPVTLDDAREPILGAISALHVVGRRNHGKTTLIVELLGELTRRGIRAGTIKHSSHAHELDTPGKDSHRQRAAGANPAAVVTPDLLGVFVEHVPREEVYERLAPLYAGCALVLVEGHLEGPGPKLEVWRASLGTAPLAAERDDISAVITDDAADLPGVTVPILPRRDLARIADHVLARCAAPR